MSIVDGKTVRDSGRRLFYRPGAAKRFASLLRELGFEVAEQISSGTYKLSATLTVHQRFEVRWNLK